MTIATEKKRQAEAADAVLFASRLGFVPDPWQAALLRSTARQVILLCSRQSGKSTTTALAALHHAVFNPNSLTLLLAPAQRQSTELFRKLKSFFNLLQITDRLPEETLQKIELANGSRVISLPGSKDSTIRGFSNVSLLIVDEAARVSDELYYSIRPMMAVSKGKIVLLSTPFGSRGFFWSEWTSGGEGWQRVKITASDCPRIDPMWLAQEKRTIGSWWFEQEYECEFKDAIDCVFSSADVDRAFKDDIPPPSWW